jgi:hypothetical protein
MTFLIVYEEVPENCYLYLVRTDDDQLIAEIRACHGKFVNQTDCPPEVETTISRLGDIGTKIYDSTASHEGDAPIVVGRIEIIVTGFIM